MTGRCFDLARYYNNIDFLAHPSLINTIFYSAKWKIFR